MLVSETRYRQITRDVVTASVAVTGQLAEAQRLIEDELRRPLEYGTGTERLPVFRDPDTGRGHVYPRRYPIESVPAPGSYEPYGTAELVGVEPDGWPASTGYTTATVTLVGGWRASDDPNATATNRIPTKLERAIALLARGLLSQPAEPVPSGITAASVGDVSVTYGEAQAGGWQALVPELGDLIDGYTYRPYF